MGRAAASAVEAGPRRQNGGDVSNGPRRLRPRRWRARLPVLERLVEGGRLRGDGRADDEVPGGRGGWDVRRGRGANPPIVRGQPVSPPPPAGAEPVSPLGRIGRCGVFFRTTELGEVCSLTRVDVSPTVGVAAGAGGGTPGYPPLAGRSPGTARGPDHPALSRPARSGLSGASLGEHAAACVSTKGAAAGEVRCLKVVGPSIGAASPSATRSVGE